VPRLSSTIIGYVTWAGGGASVRARGRAGLVIAVSAGGFAFAGTTVAVDWYGGQNSVVYLFSDAIGLSFLGAGVVAWWKRPDSLLGQLMVAGGTFWFAGNLQGSTNPVLIAVGFWLTYLPPCIGGHLILAYPHGRVRGRAERYGVAAGYLSYLGLQACRYFVEGPGPRLGSSLEVPNSTWANVVAVNGLGFTVVLFVLLVRRLAVASGPARRLHGPVWALGCLMCLLLVTCVVVTALTASVTLHRTLILSYGVCLVALPFAFLSGLVRMRLDRRRVADLVVALEHGGDPEELRDLLAEALGDPSLVLGLRSPVTGGFVDPAGDPVTVPEDSQLRAATFVERGGRRLAVLVHDQTLHRQPVVQAAVAAARLALDNAWLQAMLRAQLVQVRASRARLAEAALAERRKIERDLHDGLQHRLLRLSWLAERAGAGLTGDAAARQSTVDELAAEARDAYTTLRELARGIHPALLSERGIAAAVEEHALRCPVPITVDLPDGRCPGPVEATAYFVILEAVTNVVKHAHASAIHVRGWRWSGRLVVEVTDDGRGGADPGGSGLRGLRDRVTAIGGALRVHSAPGRGTSVVVDLPCG
jgi:signal transduction histidine kinase